MATATRIADIDVKLDPAFTQKFADRAVLVWATYEGGYQEEDECIRLIYRENKLADLRYARRTDRVASAHKAAIEVDIDGDAFELPVRHVRKGETPAIRYICFAFYYVLDHAPLRMVLVGAARNFIDEKKNARTGIRNAPHEYFTYAFLRNTASATKSVEGTYTLTCKLLVDEMTSDEFVSASSKYASREVEDARAIVEMSKQNREANDKFWASDAARDLKEYKTLISDEVDVGLYFGTVPRFFYYLDVESRITFTEPWLENVLKWAFATYHPKSSGEAAAEFIRVCKYDSFATADDLRWHCVFVFQGFVNYINTREYVHDQYVEDAAGKRGAPDLSMMEEWGGQRINYTNSFDCEDGAWYLMACVKALQDYKGDSPLIKSAKYVADLYVQGTTFATTCDRDFVAGVGKAPDRYSAREKATECHALGLLLPRYQFWLLIKASDLYTKGTEENRTFVDGQLASVPERLRNLTFLYLESTSNTLVSPYLALDTGNRLVADISAAIVGSLSFCMGCLPTSYNLPYDGCFSALQSYFDLTQFTTHYLYELFRKNVLPKGFPVHTDFVFRHAPVPGRSAKEESEISELMCKTNFVQLGCIDRAVLEKGWFKFDTRIQPDIRKFASLKGVVDRVYESEPPPSIVRWINDSSPYSEPVLSAQPHSEHALLLTTFISHRAGHEERLRQLEEEFDRYYAPVYGPSSAVLRFIEAPCKLDPRNFVTVYVVPASLGVSMKTSTANVKWY